MAHASWPKSDTNEGLSAHATRRPKTPNEELPSSIASRTQAHTRTHTPERVARPYIQSIAQDPLGNWTARAQTHNLVKMRGLSRSAHAQRARARRMQSSMQGCRGAPLTKQSSTPGRGRAAAKVGRNACSHASERMHAW